MDIIDAIKRMGKGYFHRATLGVISEELGGENTPISDNREV